MRPTPAFGTGDPSAHTAVPTVTLHNGVVMPALGLGVFQSAPEETTAAVETALQLGYRLVDTAAAYGNEREVGEGIRRSGLDRSEVFIETKVWVSDYGYEETLHAFDKAAGKLGVEQLDLLMAQAPDVAVVPAVNQIELHPYFTQPDVQAANAELDILTQAWSPIGGITFYPGWGDQRVSVMDDSVLRDLARSHDRTPAQIMLRWHLQRGRSAIPKSTNPKRIAQNLAVVDFALADDELARIDALDRGVRNGPDPDIPRHRLFERVIPEA
ncbi:MAG: aldo/keto reductase [Actinomycetota bacterium]|nr:MAG: aldo/keto reductase [Actinomycetota bacterium]